MLSHIYSKLFNNTIEDDYENIALVTIQGLVCHLGKTLNQ